MPPKILFAARAERWRDYEPHLRAALAEYDLAAAHLSCDLPPEEVDYIVYAPNSPLQDFRPYTRTKAVLNLWAGVEGIVGNDTLTQPLTRMVDPGMTAGMTEYVVGHAMRYHLGLDVVLNGQDGAWRRHIPPLAADRPVTILGLGALGADAARALSGLGFPVSGWSRTAKQIDGITCHSGPDGLKAALSSAQILVLLMPDTPATRNTLNADTLAAMPQGSFIINPGRGPLIDDDALLAALDSGHIAGATLDVFRTEPLPPDHRYWAHPAVTVTPHIASETRPSTAARTVVENIRRSEDGQPLLHLVDRARGY